MWFTQKVYNENFGRTEGTKVPANADLTNRPTSGPLKKGFERKKEEVSRVQTSFMKKGKKVLASRIFVLSALPSFMEKIANVLQFDNN